jgi:hypothetical protein
MYNRTRIDPMEKLTNTSPELASLLANTLKKRETLFSEHLAQRELRKSFSHPHLRTPIQDKVMIKPKHLSVMEFRKQLITQYVKNETPTHNENTVMSIPTYLSSSGTVTVRLTSGLGNWIFKILAGLGYAEKYGKQFVITRNNIQYIITKPHEQGLLEKITRIFPDIPIVDSVPNPSCIIEKTQFNYSPLEACSSNVVLHGYFQDEKYFPSDKLIPTIKTAYYPDTYFVHIRAGDYLGSSEFGLDLVKYYKNCFSLLDPSIKFTVFSNDNKYAETYMKQFGVSYTLSDKVDQVDTLIEMANCAGGICANSSFSWLAGLFQNSTRRQIFMPSTWMKNGNCSGIYPTWATVISVNAMEHCIVKSPVKPMVINTMYKLEEWQILKKDTKTLIVQASSICGGDLWMPFPIGMSWQYVKYFNNTDKWQIGKHEHLVLLAISSSTDSRRRPSGINRKSILDTLEKKGITNIQLRDEAYFSSLLNYKFVISPEGNGIDCHRHYEALLAGCIPIMEYNDKIQEKYKGLPILYTKDYSEITLDYLEQKYKEMKGIKYDFSRLFLSYYSIEQQEEIKKCGNYWIKKCCGKDKEWYIPNIVWITLINKGYVDFTKNFLESMRRNNCIFPLIVYCTDNESLESFQSYSNVTCVDAKPFLKFEVSVSLTKWAHADYKKLVFAKLDAIKYAVSQYPGSYIGYIDTDIILFKNPTDTILNTFKSNPDAIFVSQCDEPNSLCSNTNNCQHICSGVIVFKNTNIINKVLEYTDLDLKILSGDQEFIMIMAKRNNIKHITIEKNIFLNGVYPGVNNLNVPLIVPSSADLIHYNYLVGSNKINLMKKNNMWFI